MEFSLHAKYGSVRILISYLVVIWSCVLCGSKPVHRKMKHISRFMYTKNIYSKRPAATDVLPTSHNSDQHSRETKHRRLSWFEWSTKLETSVVGGQTWWRVWLVRYWGKEQHTAAKTLSASRRQFRRPAVPRNKSIRCTIGGCHDATIQGCVWCCTYRGIQSECTAGNTGTGHFSTFGKI